MIIHTYRFSAHSKGDDPRTSDELARLRQFDPLTIHGTRLAITDREKAENDVASIIQDAFNRADADPFAHLLVEKHPSKVGRSTLNI